MLGMKMPTPPTSRLPFYSQSAFLVSTEKHCSRLVTGCRSACWEFDHVCIANSWDKHTFYGCVGPTVENINAQILPETLFRFKYAVK